MARDVEYHFDARKLAVFTWFGCSLETTGSFKVEYVGRETSMQYHLNVHLALDQIRQSSMRAVSNGPRVLILGPSDSGKTTLAKTLANYSSKLAVAREQAAFAPIYVDLDTNEVFINKIGISFIAWNRVGTGDISAD